MTRDPRGAGPAEPPESVTRPGGPPVARVAGEHGPVACGRGARRTRLYTGSLATLGCYAAVARGSSPAGTPSAWHEARPGAAHGAAIRSSTPR
jgi:hypothetical protein